MQKKFIISIVAVVLIGAIFFMAGNGDKSAAIQSTDGQPEKKQENSPMPPAKILAERIEVVHFHAAQQCWSCATVGEYALKTIKEKFPEEYKNGTIVFKDINGELPENRDMVMKYQARGSSLFVNAITGEESKIEEDAAVWRLISNENQFIDYFYDKLNKLLGK